MSALANEVMTKLTSKEEGLIRRKLQISKTAVAVLEQEAAQGTVEAIRELGVLYSFGIGVQENQQKSSEYFIGAAKRGDEYARGMCFYCGHGVTKDYKNAAKSYQRAVESGCAPAQSALAWHYAEGQGVDKDEKHAHELWHKAASQGFAPAQYNLRLCYAHGHGIAKDEGLAVEWYRKAAEQGHADAAANLERLSNGSGNKRLFCASA